MATEDPPVQHVTSQESFRLAHLPTSTQQNLSSLASRLRNPTLYTFPECRHTIVSFAETLAAKSLLKSKKIPFTIIEQYNTNYMSPNMQVPLLIQDTLLAGGYDKITNIVGSVHPRLLVASPDTTKYCDIITRVFMPTIEYCQFLTNDTIRDGVDIVATKLPFPLNYIVPLQEKLQLMWKYYGKSEDCIYRELGLAMSELNTFAEKCVDPESEEHLVVSCKLYGYLRAIMQCFKEESEMRNRLRAFPGLNQFYARMNEL